MRCDLIIHIGGPKSGSTSLQLGLFKNLANVVYFGEYGDGATTREEDSTIRRYLSTEECLLEQNQKLQFRLVCEGRIRQANGSQLIFSSADILEFQRPRAISESLSDIFGSGIKILLVVRNQISALTSFYSGHGAWLRNVPSAHFRRFTSLENWFEYQFRLDSGSHLYTFSYWNQLKPFIEIFGRDNVHVVCFEDLIQANLQTWSKIASLLDISADRALRLFGTVHERKRISNLRFFKAKWQGQLPVFSGVRQHVSDLPLSKTLEKKLGEFKPTVNSIIIDQIHEFYKEQNRSLGAEFKLDLARHSYPL